MKFLSFFRFFVVFSRFFLGFCRFFLGFSTFLGNISRAIIIIVIPEDNHQERLFPSLFYRVEENKTYHGELHF